jgi:hypothetical protein
VDGNGDGYNHQVRDIFFCPWGFSSLFIVIIRHMLPIF